MRAIAAAVVLASGGGSRFGGAQNKVYLPLAGRRVISWSLNAMTRIDVIGPIVLTVRPQDRDLAHEIVASEFEGAAIAIVDGGETRHDSERNAFRFLESAVGAGDIDVILVHDGARPLINETLITTLIRVARDNGGAVPGFGVTDVVEVDSDGRIRDRFEAASLVRVQTPQAFRAAVLLDAYEAAEANGFIGSDTSASVERFTDTTVTYVPGDERNIKLTYAPDLLLAEQIIGCGRSSEIASTAPESWRGESNRDSS